jgi:hypothetical protein
MPLIFVHGVNTRDTDPDYVVTKEARRALFRDIVVVNLRKRFPNFDVLDDVYWGDLGVEFRWDMASVPETRALQSLGTEDGDFDNPALLEFIAENSPDPGEVAEPLGGLERLGNAPESTTLVQALRAAGASETGERSKARAGDVVRRVFAPEGARFDPVTPSRGGHLPDREEAEASGEQLAILFRAADEVAREVDANPILLTGAQNDSELLDEVERLVFTKYGDLLTAAIEAGERADDTVPHIEHLGGIFDTAKQFAVDKLHSLVEGAKSVVTTVRDKPGRAASLVLFQGLRDQISRKGLRFFGDVFVYLHSGVKGDIIERVSGEILKAWAAATKNNEPLIVVTHSFGSELLYEALTGGVDGMDQVVITLWASAGAQTSLFAEMALYASSNRNLPTSSQPTIGVPAQVRKWINFYDAADALSYLHKPVFGEVKDIEVREGANLKTAHGHYFLMRSFYETVLAEVDV